jgi:hypothetical protein
VRTVHTPCALLVKVYANTASLPRVLSISTASPLIGTRRRCGGWTQGFDLDDQAGIAASSVSSTNCSSSLSRAPAHSRSLF